MDINKLLNGVTCVCGRRHKCDIQYVYIEENAVNRLSRICGSRNNILIVADQNTYAAAGRETVAQLSGKNVKEVIFSGGEVLVPNEKAIAEVTACTEAVELIIGIGSGVIQDLCKYVSFCSGIPYLVVATAPSMDGYASNGAAMITGGMKVTYPAGLPEAILADTRVLANAPMDMIKAGYGDILGKYSALNDWKLSQCVNGEYFCPYIYELTYQQITGTLALAEGLMKRDLQSIRALMEALVVIGILMSFAGSSRPASGSEHHLSHFFEITGILDGSDYLAHGLDVAYGTFVTARLRERICESPFPERMRHPRNPWREQRLRQIYKQAAQGCIELQNKVGSYEKDRTGLYLEKEAQIRSILSEMPSSEQIRQALSLAELDVEDFYAFYGKKKIDDAILYAKDLKDRYTVLWLYYDMFGEDSGV